MLEAKLYCMTDSDMNAMNPNEVMSDLLGKPFYGLKVTNVITQAWLEDGWIIIQAEEQEAGNGVETASRDSPPGAP